MLVFGTMQHVSKQFQHTLGIETKGQGLYEFTDQAVAWVRAQGVSMGLLTLFCRHTSASLTVQENVELPLIYRGLAADERRMLARKALEAVGLKPMAPSEPGIQFAIMDALEAVKLHGVSEDAYSALGMAVRSLASDGATALIAGCTEASLVIERHPPDLPWLDPLQILAEALVREAMGRKLDSTP